MPNDNGSDQPDNHLVPLVLDQLALCQHLSPQQLAAPGKGGCVRFDLDLFSIKAANWRHALRRMPRDLSLRYVALEARSVRYRTDDPLTQD